MADCKRMPVLVDEASGSSLPELSVIIEYLAQPLSGAAKAVAGGPEGDAGSALLDRVFDNYVMTR